MSSVFSVRNCRELEIEVISVGYCARSLQTCVVIVFSHIHVYYSLESALCIINSVLLLLDVIDTCH